MGRVRLAMAGLLGAMLAAGSPPPLASAQTASPMPVSTELAALEGMWGRNPWSGEPDGIAAPDRSGVDFEPGVHADVLRYGLEVGPAIALLKPPDGFDTRHSLETICPALEKEARASKLPAVFLARLVWQESRFDPDAVSPKGAQGIAQFMPGTAAERGLLDPFDPVTALAESARFLRDLRAEFGNLGLAAAAYNAGPQRVRDWLAGATVLPAETEDYVLAITGRAAADWAEADGGTPDLTGEEVASFQKACRDLAEIIRGRPPAGARGGPRVQAAAMAPPPPWGVQVAGDFSRERALASYGRLQKQYGAVLGGREPMVLRAKAPGRGTKPLFAVRLGAESREAADQLCAQLRTAGGACMVVKN